jgi:hypothetical protein
MTGPPDAPNPAGGKPSGARVSSDQPGGQIIERENSPNRASVKPPPWRSQSPPKPATLAAPIAWGAWRIFAVDEPIVKRGTAACTRCGAAHEISLAGEIPRCGCLATRGAWR